MTLLFEWDPTKARANRKKHRLGFNDATAVFRDPLARIFPDEWHSNGERREIIIGRLANQRLALVVFTEPSPGHVRIISARFATPREQRDHEQFLR